MVPVKNDHCQCHQSRIKDINKVFVFKNYSTLPLAILGKTKDRPDEYEKTADIERHNVWLPGDKSGQYFRRWASPKSSVKYDGGDDEKSEEDDLD
jgi:hypothetical protein